MVDMDFIRSCGTNTKLVCEAANLTHRLYESTDASISHCTIYKAIKKLREQRVLCTISSSRIVVFSFHQTLPTQDQSASSQFDDVQIQYDTLLKELGYQQVQGEDGEASRTDDDWRTATLDDWLRNAVSGAVSTSFEAVRGIVPFGRNTWLFDPFDDSDGPSAGRTATLLRLNLNFTSAHALYCSTTISRARLQRHSRFLSPQSVWLAPFARPARYVGISCNDNGSPYLQDHRPIKSWVLHLLQSEMIEIGSEEPWMIVQIHSSQTKVSFPWPARLVFTDFSTRHDQHGTHSWTPLFMQPGDDDAYRSPIDFAEYWFMGDAERCQAEHSSKQNVFLAEKSLSEVMTTSVMAQSSPTSLQRTTESIANFSGIYPTPPDGLLQPTQPQPAPLESSSAVNTGKTVEQNGDVCTGAESKAEQAHEMEGHEDGDTNDADLFGEGMSGMEYHAGEIGDADFSFFDETPNVETVMTDLSRHAKTDETLVAQHDPETPAKMVVDEVIMHADASLQSGESTRVEQTILSAASREGQEPELTPVEPLQESVTENAPVFSGEDEKPLSPFGVRERLLPPPIPASAAQCFLGAQSQGSRRKSTFQPVLFRQEVETFSKYGALQKSDIFVPSAAQRTNISIPQRPKQSHPRSSQNLAHNGRHDDVRRYDDSSESESSESSDDDGDNFSTNSHLSAPFASANPNKRKRAHAFPREDDIENKRSHDDHLDPALLEAYFAPEDQSETALQSRSKQAWNLDSTDHVVARAEPDVSQAMSTVSKLDLMHIAQLAMQQRVTVSTLNLDEFESSSSDLTFGHLDCAHFLRAHLEHVVDQIMPYAQSCGISEAASSREALIRSASSASNFRAGQPRAPQRSESIPSGPDISLAPSPYIRIGRGSATYELLPLALDFWETLNLGPANGFKNITSVGVVPDNSQLRSQASQFISDLGLAYEVCKLGSHLDISSLEEVKDVSPFADGIMGVTLADNLSLAASLEAYSKILRSLGDALVNLAHTTPDRTFVVYLFNPFLFDRASHYLCALFWQMYKAYNEATGKAKRLKPRSQVVLQIIPIRVLPSMDAPQSLSPEHLLALAREVYGRCPPIADKSKDQPSPLLNYHAPFVELASVPMKRIGFQLVAEPPSDLLHEGSIMHLAYSQSSDRQWIVAAWIDATGRYESSAAFSLRGKCMTEVAQEMWRRTREIIQARQVCWRVYITTADQVDESVARMWREVIETPRKQAYSVTLVHVRLSPTLHILRPPSTQEDGQGGGMSLGAGFLTPATTPQALNSMTASPDANGLANAPPTPAPSENLVSLLESDPEAILTDPADDIWTFLLSSTFLQISACKTAQVSGMLVKRGADNGSASIWDTFSHDRPDRRRLPSLGVDLIWTVQVRPGGAVDPGNVKLAEMTLREVLRMFRNLHVLTRARGLSLRRNQYESLREGIYFEQDGDQEESVLPVHLVVAILGARGLNAFLD